jgi:hypothetical protein
MHAAVVYSPHVSLVLAAHGHGVRHIPANLERPAERQQQQQCRTLDGWDSVEGLCAAEDGLTPGCGACQPG